MANQDVEYRINIIADIQPTPTPKKPTSIPTAPTDKVVDNATVTPTATPSKLEGLGSAISASFLIQSGQKLISASGNNVAAKAIGDTMKYGTLVARSFSGNFTAMASLAIELTSEAIKYFQKLKQEAEVSNQAKFNQIMSGQIFLGNNQVTTVSRDWIGNVFYNRN